MTLDQIVIVILSSLMIAGIAYSLLLHKKIDKLSVDLLQQQLDNGELLLELSRQIEKNSTLNPNDSFTKFLTDSRESAFEYIENAQKTIIEFLAIADKMPKAKSISKDMATTYREAYLKLIDLLPVNANDND